VVFGYLMPSRTKWSMKAETALWHFGRVVACTKRSSTIPQTRATGSLSVPISTRPWPTGDGSFLLQGPYVRYCPQVVLLTPPYALGVVVSCCCLLDRRLPANFLLPCRTATSGSFSIIFGDGSGNRYGRALEMSLTLTWSCLNYNLGWECGHPMCTASPQIGRNYANYSGRCFRSTSKCRREDCGGPLCSTLLITW
jgi:hypothetical protein